jgi:hypothetical protein
MKLISSPPPTQKKKELEFGTHIQERNWKKEGKKIILLGSNLFFLIIFIY